MKLKSNEEDAIVSAPGQRICLNWLVKNESKQQWPRFPILRNVTTSAKTMQFISMDQTPELLVRTKLGPQAEFQLYYEFSLPQNIPINGVYNLRFQMIDPYAFKVKEKKLRDKDLIDEVKFGDIIHITISVEADDGLQLDVSNIGSQENSLI